MARAPSRTVRQAARAAVLFDVPGAPHGDARRLALQWLLSDGSMSQELLLVLGTP